MVRETQDYAPLQQQATKKQLSQRQNTQMNLLTV